MIQTSNYPMMMQTSNGSKAGLNTQKRGPDRSNAILRQNGAKIAVSPEENVRGHVKRIEDWIDQGQTALREYKKEIEMLRQEIGLMENHLSTQNDENVKVINPYVMANFEELQASIIKQ